MTDDRTPCPRSTTPPAARRLAVAGALLACAGFALPVLTGSTAAARPGPERPAPERAAPGGAPLDVLQLNLCHRDADGCAGDDDTAVRSGIAAIRQRGPDVVTLNEVCAHDITTMSRDTGYRAEFAPELTGDAPVRCADGRGDHGVAVLTHPDLGASDGAVVERGFAAQDAGPTRRVLLCVPFPALSACTAQLSPADPAVARRQCAELVGAATGTGRPAVVGGDLNLTAEADVRGCLPANWSHAGDGAVQHVLADTGFTFVRSENLPVDGSSHPGLLAELTG
ncbi:endonuclease/exonuclease/phosphatase family protein [Saccharopolyspora gregorii]|uniref:Endonuclease/exonuclease/phosphatase domain-containing protein n=1 Tax=Saccharopolyspora gregorii TaxID=33914 RepID=A0ABP6S096_9PSEU